LRRFCRARGRLAGGRNARSSKRGIKITITITIRNMIRSKRKIRRMIGCALEIAAIKRNGACEHDEGDRRALRQCPGLRVRQAHRGRVGSVCGRGPRTRSGATHFASSAEHGAPAKRLVTTDPRMADLTGRGSGQPVNNADGALDLFYLLQYNMRSFPSLLKAPSPFFIADRSYPLGRYGVKRPEKKDERNIKCALFCERMSRKHCRRPSCRRRSLVVCGRLRRRRKTDRPADRGTPRAPVWFAAGDGKTVRSLVDRCPSRHQARGRDLGRFVCRPDQRVRVEQEPHYM
jgi:hypothetical protein